MNDQSLLKDGSSTFHFRSLLSLLQLTTHYQLVGVDEQQELIDGRKIDRTELSIALLRLSLVLVSKPLLVPNF